MATVDDVLSFDDIGINALVCSDVIIPDEIKLTKEFLATNYCIEVYDMTRRFIHTFLEWDLYDENVLNNKWKITYFQKNPPMDPAIFTIKAQLLREAEKITAESISQLLGIPIRLKKWAGLAANDLEEIYQVVGKDGSYHGAVKISSCRQELISKDQEKQQNK